MCQDGGRWSPVELVPDHFGHEVPVVDFHVDRHIGPGHAVQWHAPVQMEDPVAELVQQGELPFGTAADEDDGVRRGLAVACHRRSVP